MSRSSQSASAHAVLAALCACTLVAGLVAAKTARDALFLFFFRDLLETAPDGVIEGIEAPAYRFCIGVQWHPEFLISEGDARLFRAFLGAAATK